MQISTRDFDRDACGGNDRSAPAMMFSDPGEIQLTPAGEGKSRVTLAALQWRQVPPTLVVDLCGSRAGFDCSSRASPGGR